MSHMFNHVHCKSAVFNPSATAPYSTGTASSLAQAAATDPRELPLILALPLIAGLSLALWAGVGWSLGLLTFG